VNKLFKQQEIKACNEIKRALSTMHEDGSRLLEKLPISKWKETLKSLAHKQNKKEFDMFDFFLSGHS